MNERSPSAATSAAPAYLRCSMRASARARSNQRSRERSGLPVSPARFEGRAGRASGTPPGRGDHRRPADHWSRLSTLTGVWLWADVERIIVPLLRTPDPHRVGHARDDNRATVDRIYYALDQTSRDEEEGHHEDSESACIGVPVDDALPDAEPTPLNFEIVTLSNRSDLISGGDALVEVRVPKNVPLKKVTLSLNGHDVTSAFQTNETARTMRGVLTGLVVGENEFLADSNGNGNGRPRATLWILNHPIGGPVLLGSQT